MGEQQHETNREQAKYQTTPELAKLADYAISRAKEQMEKQGTLTPIFVLRHADGSIYPLKVPPEAARLMDIGDAKDVIFGFIRKMVQAGGYTATVFCTDAWCSEQTEKGNALSRDEFDKLWGEFGSSGLAEQGYVIRRESVCCTVQTPERCLVRRVAYRKDAFGFAWSPPEDMEGPIDDFGGRQKMFGDLSEENLGGVEPGKFAAAREKANR